MPQTTAVPFVFDLNFCKTLGQGEAAFSLQVLLQSRHRRVVLHGDSGAGKSQTLRAIAGLLLPDSGHIAIQGQRLFDSSLGINRSPQERRVAFLFQNYALFPHLNVRQNIAFALHHGWRNPPREAKSGYRQVDDWLERMALSSVADLMPHQISGGQCQRTALARALIGEPAALLLDEPFSALDHNLRDNIAKLIVQLQQQTQIPMLLITHHVEEASFFAEDMVQIEHGICQHRVTH